MIFVFFCILSIRSFLTDFFETGEGNTIDQYSHESVQMEVNEEAYPLDNITNFYTYSKLKPPEKVVKSKFVRDEGPSPINLCEVNPKKHCGGDVKELFFFQVYEKGLTVVNTAELLGITFRFAYNWHDKNQLEIQKDFKGLE